MNATGSLTPAQQRVAEQLLDASLSVADIAQRLGLARGTVKVHISGIYMRLGVRCRADAIERLREASCS